MAISTLRPDGWPQTTIVGYANEGLSLYFLIFRSSQKLRNIRHDRRVSFAVGGESKELSEVTAVYAAAHASEVTEEEERDRGWDLLVSRHPNLKDFEPPQRMQAAMMKAVCKYVSVVDYRKGLGHTEVSSIGEETAPHTADTRVEDWGAVAVKPGLLRPKTTSE
jgi:nitroimidazol reductase NimA-like FMN-containing flavoprotein (pyridoxamine 5'-phosphate oxidase superfamily)